MIAGEYPNGSDDELNVLSISDPTVARDNSPDPRRHSFGEIIPDLIAYKDDVILIIEAKPNYSVDDTAGGTHGSLCLFRNKIADNQRIDRVVQLLKKQPDDHWNGKFNQMPPDTAFGHVGIRAHAASQYNRLPNADYIIGAGKKHRGKR